MVAHLLFSGFIQKGNIWTNSTSRWHFFFSFFLCLVLLVRIRCTICYVSLTLGRCWKYCAKCSVTNCKLVAKWKKQWMFSSWLQAKVIIWSYRHEPQSLRRTLTGLWQYFVSLLHRFRQAFMRLGTRASLWLSKKKRQVPLFNTPQSPNKITYAVVNIIPKIVKLKVAAWTGFTCCFWFFSPLLYMFILTWWLKWLGLLL